MPLDPLPSVFLVRAEGLSFTPLDDERLAVDARRGLVYSLNETGGRVWDMLEHPATVEDLCRRLCAEYAVDPQACLSSVSAVVGRLRSAGLVLEFEGATATR